MSPSIVDLQEVIAEVKSICGKSGKSQYFPYGGSGYKASVTHYFESSTEIASGAIQPGSVEDLQKIVKSIAKSNGSFAVKCGGHATNPGFSSTKGLQIHMARFNQISVDKESKLVHVGAGCLFEELYQALDPYSLNVVGGSGLAGVGVAGWMLGGGYSAKTSQYGLGIDNLVAVKLVLPNGEYTEASETQNPDLFFAVKGGGNNFGIVTEFTLKAHEQGEYEDFALTYYSDHFDAVKAAIARISAKQDSKANIEASFRHYSTQVTLTVHCVYDGTYSGEDPFRELKEIPHKGNACPKNSSFLSADLRRSYDNGTYDILSELPEDSESILDGESHSGPPMVGMSEFPRGRWGNVMVDEFTPSIIDEIEKQSFEVAKKMTEHGGTRVIVNVWPFTKSMFDNATESAWPHVKGQPSCPIMVYFTWEGKTNDQYWIDTMTNTLDAIRSKVHQERPSSQGLPYFINTALAEATTVEEIYRDNLPRLKELRKKHDPSGVMNRTGGFRIPLE